MKTIRKRLTYANVASTIALFLVVGGATAFAALGKNTVGTRQLKKNAVTTVKIKKNAVNTAKLRNEAVAGGKIKAGAVSGTKLADGAVTDTKLADGSVTESKLGDGAVKTGKLGDGAVTESKLADGAVSGAKINAASTPFTQRVYQVKGTASVPFTGGQLYPLTNPNYTQPAGQTDQYIGGMEVAFAAGCTAPRVAVAYLLMDAVNPTTPSTPEIIGYGMVEDKNAGAVTRQMGFAPLPAAGSPFRAAAGFPVAHTFSILMLSSGCSGGSGVNAVGGSVDVLGTT